MGTCYHAIVEVAQPVYDYTKNLAPGQERPEVLGRKHWSIVAVVEFNKNYELSMALSDHPETKSLWPKDVSSETADQMKERFIEEQLRWCSAETFIQIVGRGPRGQTGPLKTYGSEGFRGQPLALAAFLQVMAEEPWVRGLRVLFWGS